ncbi:MAG: 2-amino-4-hydroxy-6-hydroxymethyldihydropteridine diphosphokinase [Melioribacteraceae bacterium]|nr:2-amino-4-hydroxy-6-hydroxymethyldihydropteridine diphosphokinase [Melioribacteraceae bacterium]
MVNNIFLSLGSNIGDRLHYLKFAVEKINDNSLCNVLKSSSVYETKPMGNINQENYYNAVIEVETALGFFDLYHLIKSIERKAGRVETNEKWASRELDIDIIFYNQLIYDGENLKVPHKDYSERDFVVIPLLEICGEFKNPVTKKKLIEIDYIFNEKYILNKICNSLL